MSESQISWIIEKLDIDGDNMVGPDEMKKLINMARTTFSKLFAFFNNFEEADVQSAFLSHDNDGTGTISREELPNVLRSLNSEISEEDVREQWSISVFFL